MLSDIRVITEIRINDIFTYDYEFNNLFHKSHNLLFISKGNFRIPDRHLQQKQKKNKNVL